MSPSPTLGGVVKSRWCPRVVDILLQTAAWDAETPRQQAYSVDTDTLGTMASCRTPRKRSSTSPGKRIKPKRSSVALLLFWLLH